MSGCERTAIGRRWVESGRWRHRDGATLAVRSWRHNPLTGGTYARTVRRHDSARTRPTQRYAPADVVKPPPFAYVAAESVDHAVELLNGPADARVLAGGQSLLPLLNLRLAAPDLVVDIGRITELRSIAVDHDGALVVGAGAAQSDVAAEPLVIGGWPLLADAIGLIGHAPIRNRGTVCGSLAHNDPLAELPAVAIALDAELVVASATGSRRVAAADFFTGPFTTAIAEGELVVECRFPPLGPGTGAAIEEVASRPGDFATAGVVSRVTVTDGVARDARVVLFGLAPSARRATEIEAAIIGSDGPSLAPSVLDRLGASIAPADDIHASAASRRELARVLVSRSLAAAWDRCR